MGLECLQIVQLSAYCGRRDSWSCRRLSAVGPWKSQGFDYGVGRLRMGTPILLVVDEDQAVLEALAGDLSPPFRCRLPDPHPVVPDPSPGRPPGSAAPPGRNKPEQWGRLGTTVAPGSDTPRER